MSIIKERKKKKKKEKKDGKKKKKKKRRKKKKKKKKKRKKKRRKKKKKNTFLGTLNAALYLKYCWKQVKHNQPNHHQPIRELTDRKNVIFCPHGR